MTELIPMIPEAEIKKKIKETAEKLNTDYSGKNPVLMGVLKGSFIFLADLTRAMGIEHEIDLIGASSYEGTSSTGEIGFTKEPDLVIRNRHIILVEDIVDTGRTIVALKKYMQSLQAQSVKICTLIDKHERRETRMNVDYSCFTLEKGFIVGYGLDYNERFRYLPEIHDLKL
ncbi:MAG: hypoxanthine phosphoribosyltransferase [Desulfarculaceae bacterium]|nr:hypoxanthine phosphoribosyltransferase [Desulfarculaceae bacterium]